MMTTNQELNNFVPVYDVIPEDPARMREFLVEQLKRIGNQVNNREIGEYVDVEVLAGKSFIPGSNAQQYRQVFRKVINTGALKNAGTTSEPHGITFDKNFTLVSLFGGATDPVAFKAASMPNEDINLSMDSSDIIITTTADYSAYTRSFVICEYLQEL